MSKEREQLQPCYAPVYLAIYPMLADVFHDHGYALSVHGSMRRDFDLIAVPWAAIVSPHEDLINDIKQRLAVVLVGGPQEKPHGRIAYTLSIGFGECAIDLSFTPKCVEEEHDHNSQSRDMLKEVRHELLVLKNRWILGDDSEVYGVAVGVVLKRLWRILHI